jgi:hypothetical protein
MSPCCSRAEVGLAFCPREASSVAASRVMLFDCSFGCVSQRCFALLRKQESPLDVARAKIIGRRWFTTMSAALAPPSSAGLPLALRTMKSRCRSSCRCAVRTASVKTCLIPPGACHRIAHSAAARTRFSGRFVGRPCRRVHSGVFPEIAGAPTGRSPNPADHRNTASLNPCLSGGSDFSAMPLVVCQSNLSASWRNPGLLDG